MLLGDWCAISVFPNTLPVYGSGLSNVKVLQ